MQTRFRIGVIGHTGRGNYGHGLDTVWLEMPDCEIVAVADADETGLAAAQKRLHVGRGYADYRQMLDEAKPDVVAVAPRWLDQHRDMVVAAAERGMHVYMEKPFCRTLEEADEIVAACEKHKVKLAIAHQTRYSPRLQMVRQLLEEGAIGKVLEMRGRGKEDRRGGGEDLWVLGSHVMNLIHYLGGEALWCFARVLQDGQPVTRAHVQPGAEGIGSLAGDTVAAMYGLDNGVTAYFGSHRNAGGERFGLQVYGSEGVIEVLTGHLPSVQILRDRNWSPGRSSTKWLPVSSAGVGEAEPLTDRGLHGGNLLACRDLIDAIQEDRYPECNVYEARETIAMIAAVFESHRLGAPVEFPLKTRKNPLDLMT
ncbi:MAG: Gfo/Idh/MocA family oxidoreductase [Pirellulaceae bacterium]|nr:Gfo/Idh/MocA family oxidoreductase [Pirellulaceae bacterium]